MKYNEIELNKLSFEQAIIYDKRTYSQYYTSLIKTKNSLIFSFCLNNDYNLRIIKIDLFFIDFIISLTINGLFFDDNTMHTIYKKNGSFDLEYQIPKSLYSFLITLFLGLPLKKLGLSNDLISEFKNNSESKKIEEKFVQLIFKLKIKFFSYFFINLITIIMCILFNYILYYL